jgi:rare lipoprotein A
MHYTATCSLSLISKQRKLICLFIFILGVLQGCNSSPQGRYKIAEDSAPNYDYGEIKYTDITPKYEPYNVWTSRPYQVLGQYYTPLITGKGYEAEGKASWYGQKFHGHKTANGETFDMFALSAAHKTLPLPSFVKVTNLANNEHTIVRVNDRGPFHDDRILDLSYGAAKKLGFHEHGVADIKIEVVHVSENGLVSVGKSEPTAPLVEAAPPVLLAQTPNSVPVAEASPTSEQANLPGLFVQVMAIQNEEKVKSLAVGLSNLLQVSTNTPKVANIYKLQLGPLANEQKAEKLIKELYKIGFDQAFAVEVSP